MAVPKRKSSKSKRGMRRSHHALKLKSTSTCPRCKSAKLPHRVCPHCGFYKKTEVIASQE